MKNKTNSSSHLTDATFKVASPDGKFELTAGVDNTLLWYEFRQSGSTLIDRSFLALYDANHQNVIAVTGEVIATESSRDETWEQPWGEQRYIHDHHNELALNVGTAIIRFRVFNDSMGFRYELLGSGEVELSHEETNFSILPESAAWWIPALGGNHYEHLYKKTALKEIDTAHTPLTIERADGTFLAVHEAALYDYGAMNLVPTEHGLVSAITPLTSGTIGRVALPFSVPWRTVIVADKPHELGNSKIMLNLNEPSKIADTSWIKPTKFMGIWWGMFLGSFTWASGEQHGATTTNALRYINAAKTLGISALLIEGWNETWDGNWVENGDKMNFLQPYPDFDIAAVTQYAKQSGIEIVGHHETSGNITHYESQLPEAYDYYRLFGIKYVKTGYVQSRLDTGDYHSSQIGVRHYQKTVEMAAERQMMLNIHEPVKGTGTERTWPNLLTREGVMGQEYEGGAVTPEHATVLPFTRLLAGPLDYTPGLFKLTTPQRKVSSTIAKQLAFYVTMYSPMQMVADLPENYFDNPAFAFIREVPVNWEASVPIDGRIGEYYIIARKDRSSDNWYVGGVTDEQARSVKISLDFLPGHQTFELCLYRDGDDADWKDNPESIAIETHFVTSTDNLEVTMAPGGGFVATIKPEGETPYPYPHNEHQ